LSLYEEYLAKLSILKNDCKLVNRNYESVIKSWQGIVVLENMRADGKQAIESAKEERLVRLQSTDQRGSEKRDKKNIRKW
jgi:hypothetical protein